MHQASPYIVQKMLQFLGRPARDLFDSEIRASTFVEQHAAIDLNAVAQRTREDTSDGAFGGHSDRDSNVVDMLHRIRVGASIDETTLLRIVCTPPMLAGRIAYLCCAAGFARLV